ncbi:MAG TPA: FUSC family protein [Bryobacteraceae bacterium]|nr:FUSC family protein [Bryobacteraceae bacterium]
MPSPHPTAWQAYWRKVTHFDRGKLEPWIALRNAVGITLPLAVGVVLGMPRPGLAMSSGALQVAYSDGHDPYARRVKRMLASCLLCASAVVIGGLAGHYRALAMLVLAAWAFATGLVVVLGAAAESLGIVSLVLLIIYVGQPLTPRQAALAGLLALSGGLLQAGLSLALWPFRRYEPERRVLSDLYSQLARMATGPLDVEAAPPASAEITLAQQTLAGLGDDHGVEGERYWSLLNQAERIRLSILALRCLPECTLLEKTASVLRAIAQSLMSREAPDAARRELEELESLAESYHAQANIRFTAEALVGQLRSALRTATEATLQGAKFIESRVAAQPWQKRFGGNLARLRANLSLRSPACRHAIRMAACLVIAELLVTRVQSQRSYWLAMTIVLVLKPDFSLTFSRGLLRIGGTVLGLLLATAVFRVIPAGFGMEVVLVGVFGFLLRWLGGGNFGAFTTAASALVVVLLAMAGVAPKDVVVVRGEMTLLGGLIALAAYLVWPTWEREQAPDALAQLLDRYRAYFHEVARLYLQPGAQDAAGLNDTRLAARLARSNLEASADRFRAEPGTREEESYLLAAILASSHRFVAAAMTLEAGAPGSGPASEELRKFADDIEVSLKLLCRVLRGTDAGAVQFPDLREDYRQMAAGAGPLVREEADRMTNSLNTLWEQVGRWNALK